MNFFEAVELIKKGKAIRLPKWTEDISIKGIHLLTHEDENKPKILYALYVSSRYGELVWYPTENERVSLEWEVVD